MKNIKLLFAVGFLAALLMACSSNDEVTQPEETEPEKEEIVEKVEETQEDEVAEGSSESAEDEAIMDELTRKYYENEHFVNLFETINESAFSDIEVDYEFSDGFGTVEEVEKDGNQVLLHSFTIERLEGDGALLVISSIERFFEEKENGTVFQLLESNSNMDVFDNETKEKIN
ncbi:hypothetical protein BALCAV_0221170 [Alkalihalobacillus alcalophilus ATCC 27647 = CGMCC 1.3604]|uniref:Lipoprotein n=1 Tax=Alkalihalobacillus alcalophilus ATCC 27647 = CGMCC 1.3604 TaxID=1218173 RepID=A0A094YQ92_ALKAL|nr:hypothetical protein [Alkalihalobacillus alcalophilus]KGA95642.1 hypothetical protein BALCAV_0221170 [Alkalihalobacillus alcalophilus ATCC 27647 = CGMCC 1.3604]MED1563995.1 hypothetical protein [Alkalihalobacillus alcalophilus]